MKHKFCKMVYYSFYVVLSALLVTACTKTGAKYVCTCEQLDDIQGFIERSINSSSYISDVEMDNTIHQLWVTGVKLNCSKKVLPLDLESNIDWSEVELDSCETAYSWVH